MTTEKFEELKNKIEESKENIAKQKGSKERILNQLKEDYGVNSKEEAEELVKKMESQISKKTEKKNILIEELDSKVDWDSL